MAYHLWTEAETTELKMLFSEGKTSDEIGKALGRKRENVENKKKRLGLRNYSRQLWTEAETTELKMLFSEGKTSDEIGKALGRKRENVENKKKRLGLRNFSRQLWTDTETERLIELVRQGKTGYEIANALGKHYKAVSTKKKRLGLCKPNSYEIWSEWELLKLRRYCKRGYPLDRICTYFPNRTREMVRERVWKMTRYWFTPEQQEARRKSREHEMEWRVW